MYVPRVHSRNNSNEYQRKRHVADGSKNILAIFLKHIERTCVYVFPFHIFWGRFLHVPLKHSLNLLLGNMPWTFAECSTYINVTLVKCGMFLECSMNVPNVYIPRRILGICWGYSWNISCCMSTYVQYLFIYSHSACCEYSERIHFKLFPKSMLCVFLEYFG